MIVMFPFDKFVLFCANGVDGETVVEGCYHTLNIKNKMVNRHVILA